MTFRTFFETQWKIHDDVTSRIGRMYSKRAISRDLIVTFIGRYLEKYNLRDRYKVSTDTVLKLKMKWFYVFNFDCFLAVMIYINGKLNYLLWKIAGELINLKMIVCGP